MMSDTIRVEDLPDFDASEHLDSPELIAMYLNEIIQEGDAALLAAALGEIARAQGMTEMAQRSGIGREALYKALRPGAEPRFETIYRVLQSLGIDLVARPKELTYEYAVQQMEMLRQTIEDSTSRQKSVFPSMQDPLHIASLNAQLNAEYSGLANSKTFLVHDDWFKEVEKVSAWSSFHVHEPSVKYVVKFVETQVEDSVKVKRLLEDVQVVIGAPAKQP
jgi:probable addiction module antidote protein